MFTDSSISARAGFRKIRTRFRADILKRVISDADIIEPGLLAFTLYKGRRSSMTQHGGSHGAVTTVEFRV